jgi:hypothetical protein
MQSRGEKFHPFATIMSTHNHGSSLSSSKKHRIINFIYDPSNWPLKSWEWFVDEADVVKDFLFDTLI